jgi:hypothetical protein
MSSLERFECLRVSLLAVVSPHSVPAKVITLVGVRSE